MPPHPDAMRIERQPERVELGAGNSHELDLWFSPPQTSDPVAVRLVGDQDADPTGTAVRPAVNRGGVTVPMNGLQS